MEKEGDVYHVDVPRPPEQVMERTDHMISELCDFLQTFTVLIISVAASCGAVLLFYRHKLKTPISELEQASKRIAQDDLDFQISYENEDEMGRLCREFEHMRRQLAQNNQKLWQNIEEERQLRAAIAHDIRSPLSVLMGYQEMLLDFLPDGTIDTAKAMEMLSESKKQLERMDTFVENMRKMSSLEQRELKHAMIELRQLGADIRSELEILAEGAHKQVKLDVQETEDVFFGDKEVILEVTENLLSNALRYAKNQVEIRIRLAGAALEISVKDDGIGFLEETEKITAPFHQQNVKDSLKHAGMGMYVSRLYCEKHGGRLLLENTETGGALATAVFNRIV